MDSAYENLLKRTMKRSSSFYGDMLKHRDKLVMIKSKYLLKLERQNKNLPELKEFIEMYDKIIAKMEEDLEKFEKNI